MNDSARSGGGHPGPAADLVGGRLRDGRRHGRQWSPRTSPRRSTSSPASGCSTSPAAAATARSPRRGGPGVTRSAPTSSRPCSSAAASAPRPSGSRSSSSRPTPRTCPSRTRASTSRCRSSARCSPPTSRRRRPSCCASVKPGGRIGMANWVPDGAVGKMFMTIAKHAPPPPGRRLAAPLGHRGAPARAVRRRRSPTCGSSARISRQPFRSADHYIEFFRTYFGPTKVAFERVGPEGEEALTADLRALPGGGQHRRRPGAGARGRVPAGDRRRAPEAGAVRASAERRGSPRR